MNDMRSEIASVMVDDSRICVSWGDGHQSRFHSIWLRDNCTCEACGNRAVGQKLALLTELPDHVAPRVVDTDDDGNLRIEWAQDGHQSCYAPTWLREHCYSDDARSQREHHPRLWDASLQDALPETTHDDCFRDDAGQLGLLEFIRDYGFAIVHGVPADQDSYVDMVRRIGFLRETNYGKVGDLISTGAPPRTLSDTKHRIPLHTDECYRHANPGMLAFLCLSASEDGAGATLLADGFMLADQLRARAPEHFELLSRVPVNSRRHHPDEVDLRSQSPVISVDFRGRVQGVRYNERSAGPLDVPETMVEPVYAALRSWLELCRNPDYQIRLLLRPGDFIVFDNQRVLHGRESFSGHRHLLYGQLDLDEPHSRARVLSQRLGREPDGLVMHRGT